MTEQKSLSQEEIEAINVIAQNELIIFCVLTNGKYNPAWVHDEIASKLEAVERGDIKRLIITMPPRHGKSELGSINFPAWYLGKHPNKEVIVASYSSELAEDFGSKTRNLVNSPEYHQIFNTKLRDDSQSKSKWLTQIGGGYTAVGVGGSMTGKGADLFSIDDPFKNRKEAESKVVRDAVWSWFTSTAYTRLEKNGVIVLILTRWHKNDLAGRLLKAEEEGGEHWEIINFPAIAIKDEEHRQKGEALWPEKYSLEDLKNIKNTLGPYDWESLYQQNPVATENQEFKETWFKYRDRAEVDKLNTRKILTVDTAYAKKEESDFCGFCENYVDRENMWNLAAYKLKLDPKDLIDYLFTIQEKRGFEKIAIEETAYSVGLKVSIDIEMRKRGKFLPIVLIKHNNINKEVRIRGLIPRFSSGSVFLIKGECKDLEEEATDFPRGIHDDVIDATAIQLQIPSENNIIPKPINSGFESNSEFYGGSEQTNFESRAN